MADNKIENPNQSSEKRISFTNKFRYYSRVTYAVTVFFLKCLSYVFKAFWNWLRPKEPKSLENEVALITGGGAGLGRLIALELARNKCSIVLWDLDKNGIEKTLSEIRSIQQSFTSSELSELTAHGYVCDVTDCKQVYSVAEKTRRDIGRDVTILVNNAGVASGSGAFLDTPDHLIRRVFEVNSMAMCWTVKAWLPAMMSNNKGHIVTIASMAGYVGISRLVDYCASKHAAVGFDEALRVELEKMGEASAGIHTTVISPYFLKATGMFEKVSSIIPQLEPEYVAEQTVLSIRHNRKELLMPGYLWPILTLRWIVPWECVSLFLRVLVPDAAPPKTKTVNEQNSDTNSDDENIILKKGGVAAADVAIRQRNVAEVDHRQP